MTDPLSTAVIKLATPEAKIAFPAILKIIKKELKDMGADIHHAFFNAFETYMIQTHEKHSYLATLVFPNQQLKLKDFYLPLTLSKDLHKQSIKFKIENYPFALVSEKKDILIVDSAGMGKSTLLKFMFLKAIDHNIAIPIFIELRKLKPDQSLVHFLQSQLRGLDNKLDEQLVLRLLKSGEFIFFLDGYDEIADKDREAITEKLKDFKKLTNKNKFILTSRDQLGLNAFSDFYRLVINPLEFQEAEQLIRKYSQKSEIGEKLIERLSLPESNPIHEFLTNPLLVSLLFKAFEHKHIIPLKKHVFYRQVFDALFESHDLSKDAGELNRVKLSGLDIHNFEIALRAIGFLSLQSGVIEYTKDAVLALIQRSKDLAPGLSYSPNALLEDLITRVPLFIIDGNSYRWSHKSLQEYFAALYVASRGTEFQEKTVGSMFRSHLAASYINFLSLFSDIDIRGYRQSFLHPLAEYLLSRLKTPTHPGEIPIDQLEKRKSLTVLRKFVYVNLEFDEIKAVLSESTDTRGEAGMWTRAEAALEEAYPNCQSTAGSFTNANDMVVILDTKRFNAISTLIKGLLPEFVTIREADRRGKNDRLKKSEIFPLGFTALTDDPQQIFNVPANFEHFNRILSYSCEAVMLDAKKAKNLISKIKKEKKLSEAGQFNF